MIDTTQVYSKETEEKFREKYAEYEKDENGEDIMSVSLADVNIVAKSKNVPERAGKITLDFKVDVPASLINNKWQIQLTPVADKNGNKIQFDKILISGAQFLRQQERGYQMYQNFISSIIPDSAYMQYLFDSKGYQKLCSRSKNSSIIPGRKNCYRNPVLWTGVMCGISVTCCLTA